MDCTVRSFPGNLSTSSTHIPNPISHSPWLYNPAQDELIYSSLDLSFQINVAVSRVDREIIDNITRDRDRRIFH